ncbi:MAG: PIN domain-containing protein [Microthrixaceae bacterium]
MDAFDADVLIYAAEPGHALGSPVRALFESSDAADETSVAGVGSVLLLPELLSRPLRNQAGGEVGALAALLGRLDLLPVDLAIAELATALGARHRLRAVDAVHLATAVAAGADRFITNNSHDFSGVVTEIDIVTPAELP